MKPVCGWTQWRISNALDGGRIGPRALRHLQSCARCSAYRASLLAWVHALRPERPEAEAPLPPDVHHRFLEAVRAVDRPVQADSRRPRDGQAWLWRPAVAGLLVVMALALSAQPLATRTRRNRAVQHLSRAGTEWVHWVPRVSAVLDTPIHVEHERLAYDIARGLRFVADGLPLLGALEAAGLDDSIRYQ